MRVAYIDSSVLVRYYLPLDPHHDEAIALIDDDDTAIVTSSWTRIEASGALVRASRSQRVSPDAALARLDEDTSVGPITLISVPQAEAESIAWPFARQLARAGALRRDHFRGGADAGRVAWALSLMWQMWSMWSMWQM